LPAAIDLPYRPSKSDPYDQSLVEDFRQGMRDAGLVENRDVLLDVAWTSSELDLSQAVVRLKQRDVRLLIPVGTTASLAVKRQAPMTPILFISVGNPLGIGLVENLARPGGDVTGFGDILAELGSKYVELAVEMTRPQRWFTMWYPGWKDGQYRFQVTERAAQSLGVKLQARPIEAISALDDVMKVMKRAGAAVLIVQPSPFTYLHRDRFVATALQYGLATIFAFQPAAGAGTL
jgi:putative ABC transport system substrate-binding protein